MAKHSGKEVGPGTEAQSDDELNEYIRSKAETAYHPSCTLKMGVDKMAVVDQKLKIHGLENIRCAFKEYEKESSKYEVVWGTLRACGS